MSSFEEEFAKLEYKWSESNIQKARLGWDLAMKMLASKNDCPICQGTGKSDLKRVVVSGMPGGSGAFGSVYTVGVGAAGTAGSFSRDDGTVYMRPTMNFRIRVDKSIEKKRLVMMPYKEGKAQPMLPCVIEQEWVSDNAMLRQWREIEVME